MPPAKILVANAHLVGLWLQLFATGAYCVYLPQCFLILRKKMREGMSWWMPAICALMFGIVITDLITELWRAFHAFSVSGPTGQVLANPAIFYANAASPESLVKNSITVALAIISDFIIVYRTFIVWNFNFWIIIIPIGLLCADIAFGIWSTWTLAQTKVGDNLILAAVTVRVRYFFIFTFALNMLCACLICWKIWRINSRVSHATAGGDRTTHRVFEVVIETAALYCAHLFILIVTDSIGSNVFFIFLDALPPVTALVFSMLIVRTRTNTQQIPSTFARSTNIRFWSSEGGRTAATHTGGIGVEIDLERVVHTDTETTRTGGTYGEGQWKSTHEDF